MPSATTRSRSSVMVACQVTWSSTRSTGRARAVSRPSRTARMKRVWLLTPTTWCSSPTVSAAPMLQTVSLIAQYTPPWTIPYACMSLPVTSISATTSRSDAAVTTRPSVRSSGPA
ncbi:hypothetical protein GCM10009527_051280 [Actinomadura nitritigenes]